MLTIEITQKNWDGKGNDRTFYKRGVRESELERKLGQIARAYNQEHTEVQVIE